MASVKMGVAGRAALGLVFTASLVATTGGTAHAVAGSSSAYGIKASLGPVNIPETARSAYPAGPPSANVLSLNVPRVGKVEGIATTASGDATTGVTKSTARTAKASLLLGPVHVAAEAVGATCNAKPGYPPTGKTLILKGTLKAPTTGGSVNLPANPGPNTKITLPAGLGQIVLNEQIRNADGSLTVNAVHIKVATHSPLKGDLILASTTCKAGKADKKKGAITSIAYDKRGDRVGGVAFELNKDTDRALAPSCTGNSMGYCTFPNLPAGTYEVCVTDVPDGYRMPRQACKDDIVINGNHRYVRFLIPEEHGKKKH